MESEEPEIKSKQATKRDRTFWTLPHMSAGIFLQKTTILDGATKQLNYSK